MWSVCKNKLQKRCILLAVIWNYITMHGHMNIKYINYFTFEKVFHHKYISSQILKLHSSLHWE